MTNAADLLVIGAGPAGVGAATMAAEHGLDVVLIDENYAAGGQVYRPMPPGFARRGSPGPDAAIGDAQRELLARSPVRTAFGKLVWSVSQTFRVDAVGEDGPTHWTAPALIAATGATERVIPFPGWTEPGVIGLAAATALLKSQQMLPGRTTLVAGCGPLLLAVAAGILKAGGRVAAVVDLASPVDWMSTLPALASRPDLLARGVGWVTLLKRRGVPVLFRHAIIGVRRSAGGLAATIGPVDAARRPISGVLERELSIDCVAVGHGLVPGTEISRIFRARHRFEHSLGGWIAERDRTGRTSVGGLYVAGDSGGILGAAAAFQQGRMTGLAAARDRGRIDPATFDRLVTPIERSRARNERFGRAMSGLMAAHLGQAAAIAPETIICRCEDVTRAELDAAIDEGAATVDQLKAWTRCGMGPCQGRMCGDTAGALMALRVGDRESAGQFTGRPPLRPIPIDLLTGTYDYADIPIPGPAPL
ncbi:MAG TPA: NAD(P)/FAD-dependent oxidoreductase [Stellaceae bacterium]|nr:NAD(P)/FAD-dependent oxidoreductase [Stellaceae bacterium]